MVPNYGAQYLLTEARNRDQQVPGEDQSYVVCIGKVGRLSWFQVACVTLPQQAMQNAYTKFQHMTWPCHQNMRVNPVEDKCYILEMFQAKEVLPCS